jgi:hypothetical protein
LAGQTKAKQRGRSSFPTALKEMRPLCFLFAFQSERARPDC